MNATKVTLLTEDKLDVANLEPGIPSHSEIASLNEIIECLSQQNHELKFKLSQMVEEKVALLTKNAHLNAQLTAHLNDPDDPESIHISLKHQEEYKKECDRLREENYRLETVAYDSKLRIQVIEKQLSEVQQKLALSQSVHDEALRNKDELDSLREAAARVPQLENAVQLYERKLEAVDVLKQHIKELEEQNSALNKASIPLEDDIQEAGTWKMQMEDIKKKLIETQQALSQENQNCRRLNFELERTREELGSVQALADRIQERRNADEFRRGWGCCCDFFFN